MKNILLYTLLSTLLVNFMATGQENNRKPLKGAIQAESNEIEDVTIENKASGRGTISGQYGFFSIDVQLNDTLVFSAVQFKKKILIVNAGVMASKSIIVAMEPADNQLDEVVVMPYNLSGDLTKDLQPQKVVVAATLGLPNAYVKVKTQNERKLAEADGGGWVKAVGAGAGGAGGSINLHKILNRVTGRTKKLKQQVENDEKNNSIERLFQYFPDSMLINKLKIPELRLYEFLYFCEADSNFSNLMNANNPMAIWELLQQKSIIFRKENELE